MNKSQKINEACEKIDASPAADGGGYIYRADETDEWYRITEAELIELSDLMHSADADVAGDAYSHWCNSTGELIGDDNATRKAGLIDDDNLPKNSHCLDPSGSHPRVLKVLSDWMLNDVKGLTFGTDAEKADCWQKAASHLEKLAKQLESELNANK